MSLPLLYSVRNLRTRKLTTALTAGGMALVVFVFAAVQMLETGLRRTLVTTGQPDNVLITRQGANTEISSAVERTQAALVAAQPQVATGVDGQVMASSEAVILITLPKSGTGVATNVTTRGVSSAGLELRPQLEIVEGRLFAAGTGEIMVGQSIARRFDGAAVGSHLRFGGREWLVTGIFSTGGAAFDSEVWGDADQLMQAFRRPAYSSLVLRLRDPELFGELKARLAADPRLTLDVKRERDFYEEQSAAMSAFISYLGMTLSVIFSIGATIGAMITMYASVASRVAEIGTLRALGFRRRSVLLAFLLEAVLLGFIGGVAGVGLAALMQLVEISTLNWQSFSELAFRFTLTPGIAAGAMAFALLMGVMGGFLPALRAARLAIVDSLRAA